MKRSEIAERITRIHKRVDSNRFGLKHQDVMEAADGGMSIISIKRIHKQHPKFKRVARSRYLLKDQYRED